VSSLCFLKDIITLEGKKEMIDFLLATSESQNPWEGFLRDLYRRRLEGTGCEMITTDGGNGLWKALEVVYPPIPRRAEGLTTTIKHGKKESTV
jgi:transposase-like protein